MDALASFLRARRRQAATDDVAAVGGRRRRTPGLRREEVALRAGISVEWYTRLEQGRSSTPSPTTVDALAEALHLNDVEHAHLHALASRRSGCAVLQEKVPVNLLRLMATTAGPAYVTGRRWDLLAWNVAATALFVDLEALAPAERNILLYMITDPRARVLFGPAWAAEARRMVAIFRTAHDVCSDEPAFVELVERLRSGCDQFEGWWQQHRVAGAVSGTKTLYHPTRGPLRYDYLTLHPDENPGLRFSVYIPVS